MNNKKKISIITPCFNEEESIEECYIKVKEIFDQRLKNFEYELIFTDNFSTDKTISILRKLAQKDKKVKIILNSRNFGVFRSTFNAIKKSKGDALIPKLDADLQDPPELIIDFINYWQKGFKVIAGKRKDREENFLMKMQSQGHFEQYLIVIAGVIYLHFL